MGRKLYVGNLPYSVTEDMLERTFSGVGRVESIKVITDRDTGRSKGFAFVEMSSDAEANAAISELNGTELDGRTMKISEARPQTDRGGGGGRGRGGYGGGGGGRGRGGYGGGGGGDRW